MMDNGDNKILGIKNVSCLCVQIFVFIQMSDANFSNLTDEGFFLVVVAFIACMSCVTA